MNIHIYQASLSDLDVVAPLFNAYRIFYKQADDFKRSEAFIRERLSLEDSVIFLAIQETDQGKTGLGFVQLYPSFSSISAQRTWILNDLYIAKQARRAGIAERLITQASHFAKQTQAKGIALATAQDNLPAQSLYEKLGFIEDTQFKHYFLSV